MKREDLKKICPDKLCEYYEKLEKTKFWSPPFYRLLNKININYNNLVKFFFSEYFWINTCFVNLSKRYRFWWQGWRKDIFLSRSGPYIQIYKKFKSLKNGLFIKMIFSWLFADWTSNYIVYYSWPISHRLIARLTHHHMTTTFINHTWL